MFDFFPPSQSRYINTLRRPWFTRPGMPRRAGVSSFGFGGANYHCVVEEYEAEHTDRKKPYRVHQLPTPVLLDAKDARALAALVDEASRQLAPHARNALSVERSSGHRRLAAEAARSAAAGGGGSGGAAKKEEEEPSSFDKRQAARALAVFKHRFSLREGRPAVPASSARVGFQADTLQQTLDTLTVRVCSRVSECVRVPV